jgi:hypothetical protein
LAIGLLEKIFGGEGNGRTTEANSVPKLWRKHGTETAGLEAKRQRAHRVVGSEKAEAKAGVRVAPGGKTTNLKAELQAGG